MKTYELKIWGKTIKAFPFEGRLAFDTLPQAQVFYISDVENLLDEMRKVEAEYQLNKERAEKLKNVDVSRAVNLVRFLACGGPGLCVSHHKNYKACEAHEFLKEAGLL